MTEKAFLFLTIIFFLYVPAVESQEMTRPIHGNPILEEYSTSRQKNELKGFAPIALDTLPFIDDFSSQESFYPDVKRWTDREVYINTGYGIDPPSIGVATLDAYNSKGAIHENLISGVPGLADTLTSVKINLHSGYSGVYLSFFYQPVGKGDFPELSDSLCLYFYTPAANAWELIWTAQYNHNDSSITEKLTDGETTINSYNQESSFFPVLIRVPKDFYSDGFQFRFANYASIAGTSKPSRAGNADHWHIDFVYLYNDSEVAELFPSIKDISFTSPLKSFLKEYSSVPWRHYNNQSDKLLLFKDTVYLNVKSQNSLDKPLPELRFINQSGEREVKPPAGYRTLIPYRETNIKIPLTKENIQNSFISFDEDSADFDPGYKLVTNNWPDDYEENNTIKNHQKFYDYYAYDDGSVELGYGLTGEGTKNAMAAYKFHPYLADSLKAIQIYFNKSYGTQKPANQKYIFIHVWDNDDGKPGDIRYTMKGVLPQFTNKFNRFQNYIFEKPVFVDDTFYIGWQQTTSDFLNIGFDINNADYAEGKLFFNVKNKWSQSSLQGALMMRPVFGKKVTQIVGIKNDAETKKIDISVYPNPASSVLHIDVSQHFSHSLHGLLYDLQGKLVLRKPVDSYSMIIDISDIQQGMYILRVTDYHHINYRDKIIIRK